MKIHNIFCHYRYALLSVLLLCFFVCDIWAEDSKADGKLHSQIKLLAKQYQFSVQGLEKADNVDVDIVTGSVQQQLEQLLSGFNHIIIRNEQNSIARLIILNKKTGSNRDRNIVSISIKNKQYYISTSIRGNNNTWVDLDLLIDTGANVVVLPMSVMSKLNMVQGDMQTSQLQTVNGKVDAYLGQLSAVEVGNEMLEKVAVAFVKDELMGQSGLLGMSFLSRYRFNIDDELEQMTLIKKE